MLVFHLSPPPPSPPPKGWLKDQTGDYTASFVVAGSSLVLGTVVMATLPGFFSRTAPPDPPKHSLDSNNEDEEKVESGLMDDSPPSVTDKLNHLETTPYAEPQLDSNGLIPVSEPKQNSRSDINP